MGNLVDAWKRGPIPLLYRCIAEAFKIWGQTFKTATSQFRNVDFITLTLTFEGTEAFIQSDLWVSFYDLHLHPAMRSIENESISQLEPIVLKYLNTAKQWLTKVHKDVEHTFNQCQTIVQQIDKATELESESRKKRLSERITAYEMSNQEVARLWNVQSQQVYFERQVWESEDTPKYYHLDPHENRLRMRRRLVRNYQFDDHHLASEKRDKVPETHRRRNSAPHAAVHALPDRKEILLERLRKLHAVTKEPSLLEFEEELPEEEPNYSSQLERCLKSVEACMIVYMTTIKGRFEVTTTHLRFFPEMLSYSRPSAPNISSPTLNTMMGSGTRVNEYKWPISMLERVFLRRYKLNPCAIEFFFTNGTAFLFTVEEENPQLERIRLVKKIMSLKPPNLLPVHFGTPLESLAATDLTQKWVNREISNFEYLMWLNTFSGRSYNDLTRYPVFPWIIANYDSQELDLNDPSVFRDLSKPMGALNETRLKYFKERAEAFEDPSGQVQKFLYGSHYSSSGGVLFYLLRLEPFTSLHIALQGGKFDHPDRQFQSFEQLWYSVTTSTSDVKELIPEFFYLPDFLRNHNHFDLGITQAGHKLDDVGLPKWAKTPEEFIRVHRRALESEYVSENLHHWVDLIWGYKQTGPQAEEANNLFYYLTYEGVVNLKDIKDPVERRSIEEQINHFGQTPSRLFLKPHPQRQSKPKASFDTLLLQKSVFQLEAKLEHPRFFFISNLCLESKRMEPRIVLMDALLEIHHYKLKETVPKIYKRQWSRRLSPDLKSRQLIAMTGDGRHVFLGGHFDLSFRHYSLVGNAVKFMDRVYEHMAKVSCLGLSEDERWLCSGSLDCTVRVWELKYTKDKCIVQRGPEKVIYGHNAQISCLLVNADHGIVVSGSQDGTVMISGLYSNISPASISLGPQISKIMLHPVDAHLYILQKDNLHIYTLNGIHVKTMSFEGIKDFDIHQSGNVLAIGLPHAVVFTHGSDLERYQHQTSLESPNLERIQFLDNQMVVFSDLQIQLITL
ncbi:hypothetical protein EDD86DRAFT_189412 [Gorgonomyces haynaldii]|nr:hypothetical protein EDD86DRAFT_189412 [Gorgonomyces haynaldii]